MFYLLQIFEDKRRLTIGFYVDAGNIISAPACQRAVSEVKAILEAQGHTVGIVDIIEGREGYGDKRHFQLYFSYIVAVNFISGGCVYFINENNIF